jgi:hypothetical protein
MPSNCESSARAHILVAFLGYALWITLKHLLKRRPAMAAKSAVSGASTAQPLSPIKALALLSTLHSADIVLPTTDGHEIRLRRVTEPNEEQQALLNLLGISLPEHFRSHQKCSADSAIA